MEIHSIAREAKHLCRQQHSGVLSTHSTSMPGYPFGSVVPFYLTAEGDAIIYISDIALHTRNIKANEKVSLTIFDAAEDDSQANGRVTIMGDAMLFDDTDAVKAQYLALFPQARSYEQTHDFHFYRIKTERVRFIGGFGKIHWINKEYWQVASQPWHLDTTGMIAHMNADHQEAMRLMLQHEAGIDTPQVDMLSVLPEGAHYRTLAGDVVFLPFAETCDSPTAVRKALVAQTQAARAALLIES